MPNNKTATGVAYDKAQEAAERRQFQRAVHSFFTNWAPEDSQEATQFHTEFMNVIRQLTIDIQKPVQDSLVSLFAKFSVPPTIVKD